MRPILIAFGALALTGCTTMSQGYGYAYCYDPYRGPVGYHYGPFEPPPPCATSATQAASFATEDGGIRGTYVSGPHPGPVTPTPTTPAGAR